MLPAAIIFVRMVETSVYLPLYSIVSIIFGFLAFIYLDFSIIRSLINQNDWDGFLLSLLVLTILNLKCVQS